MVLRFPNHLLPLNVRLGDDHLYVRRLRRSAQHVASSSRLPIDRRLRHGARQLRRHVQTVFRQFAWLQNPSVNRNLLQPQLLFLDSSRRRLHLSRLGEGAPEPRRHSTRRFSHSRVGRPTSHRRSRRRLRRARRRSDGGEFRESQ